MVTGSVCASCGSAVEAGAAFCSACGARQVRACAQCGAALAADAAFCGACGAAAGQSQPAATPVEPAACPACGAPWREGARFCRSCGAPAPPAAGAPAAQRVVPAPQPVVPVASAGPPSQHQPAAQRAPGVQLTWSSAAAGLGFAVAFLSAFLPWASVPGFNIMPLEDGARFRLGDAMDSDNIDGYLVLLVALAGLAALAASVLGRLASVAGRQAVAALGSVLLVLAVAEMQFVASREGLGASNIDFGLYMLLVGSALAAASPWIPARPLTGA